MAIFDSFSLPEPAKAAVSVLPPTATLMQLLTGYWLSQATYVVAKLGLADLLADGERSCEELAAATESHSPSLQRLLRALTSVGLFTSRPDGRYGLTPMSDLLKTGTAESMHALAVTYNEEQYRAWGDLLHSVRTGSIAFDHMYGLPIFEYFEANPEPQRVFNDAMTSWSNQVGGAVATTYDFSALATVIDVGGGHGALLASILKDQPTCRGVLFDLPSVVATAGEPLRAAGVAERCDLMGGDFFSGPLPSHGDAYILSQILHDWDRDSCLAILGQCRRVMAEGSKLLIVELVIPPDDEPFLGKWLDLHMLVMAGGRERTAAEYGQLLNGAGFKITNFFPTAAGPSVLEAIPV